MLLTALVKKASEEGINAYLTVYTILILVLKLLWVSLKSVSGLFHTAETDPSVKCLELY